jgi:hypothetical protein
MFIVIDAPMDMLHIKMKWTFLSSYSGQYWTQKSKRNHVKSFFHFYLVKQNEIKMENVNLEVMYL